MGLYPHSFAVAHPFPSFDVWDLHSLDNGVVQELFPLLTPERQGEWDVLIAHFLGVDHAGRCGVWGGAIALSACLRPVSPVILPV
jgi:predicted AlkP superfamily pyrophosphatase or phosphodiesterase